MELTLIAFPRNSQCCLCGKELDILNYMPCLEGESVSTGAKYSIQGIEKSFEAPAPNENLSFVVTLGVRPRDDTRRFCRHCIIDLISTLDDRRDDFEVPPSDTPEMLALRQKRKDEAK